MIGFIIWIIGVVLTIKAAIEIWNLNVDPVKKIVVIVLLVLTSWLGIAVYYLVAKDKLATWLKYLRFSKSPFYASRHPSGGGALNFSRAPASSGVDWPRHGAARCGA